VREREKGAPPCFLRRTRAKRAKRGRWFRKFVFSSPARARDTRTKGEKIKIILQRGSNQESRHNSAHALVSNKMTSMSSMGSHSNKDRSKTASSATVTRLFQKSLRDLITGTFLLLEFGVGKIQREREPASSPSIELRAAPDGDPFLVSFLIVIGLSSLRSLRTNGGERTTH
jgi:hypothetical protein